MKLGASGLAAIRGSLLVFLLLSLSGSALVAAAYSLSRQAENERKAALAQRHDIQGKLSRAREEEQELRSKLARYRELAARGLIGAERRLEWVERMREIKLARRLLDIEYELAPQRRLDEEAAGSYQFMASGMRLQMRLLHEEDLLNFLEDLRASVRAYLRVNHCSVERLPSTDNAPPALLKADCSIDWITVREKK